MFIYIYIPLIIKSSSYSIISSCKPTFLSHHFSMCILNFHVYFLALALSERLLALPVTDRPSAWQMLGDYLVELGMRCQWRGLANPHGFQCCRFRNYLKGLEMWLDRPYIIPLWCSPWSHLIIHICFLLLRITIYWPKSQSRHTSLVIWTKKISLADKYLAACLLET